mmetsp:Transcript_13800/g.9942  ORF Transcript_13800/g.9942 Transcript_13800/m.9942 type:complete len:142 (+) Transcript_13800:21-446(+)
MEKTPLKKPVFITTKDVEPGSRVNMHLQVQSINVKMERLNYNGTKRRDAEVIVGDQHGCLVFFARNEQIDLLQVGRSITVRNAHANVVYDHIRLEVDKWGKLEKGVVDVPSVNLSNNLSETEYELVPPAGGRRGGRGGRRY